MTDLESRVRALEESAKFEATQAAIREREQEFLVTLREIKDTMAREAAAGGTAGGGGGASSAELSALKQENEQLKAKLAKQEYRISHLIEGMEELLAKRK